jgi:hypothetical protein
MILLSKNQTYFLQFGRDLSKMVLPSITRGLFDQEILRIAPFAGP